MTFIWNTNRQEDLFQDQRSSHHHKQRNVLRFLMKDITDIITTWTETILQSKDLWKIAVWRLRSLTTSNSTRAKSWTESKRLNDHRQCVCMWDVALRCPCPISVSLLIDFHFMESENNNSNSVQNLHLMLWLFSSQFACLTDALGYTYNLQCLVGIAFLCTDGLYLHRLMIWKTS